MPDGTASTRMKSPTSSVQRRVSKPATPTTACCRISTRWSSPTTPIARASDTPSTSIGFSPPTFRKSKASLTYNRRTGGVYGAATFVALAGLIDGTPSLAAGDRVGIYSYGSGSCAEFYSATIGAGARAAIAEARIGEQLSNRRPLTVPEYEACERATSAATCASDHTPPGDLIPSLYESHYAGRHKLVFRGTRQYYRDYAWS